MLTVTQKDLCDMTMANTVGTYFVFTHSFAVQLFGISC